MGNKILSGILLMFVYFIGYSLSPPDYYPRNWNVDVKHYNFSLTLSDTSDMISGNTVIRVFFSEKTDHLVLDLVSSNEEGAGMQVKNVLLNEEEVPYTHRNDQLIITPATPFKKSTEITIAITYSGIPIDGLLISKNKFGERTFFGDNWPDRARHWLPTVDHPSDKAGVDFIITAPEKYQVVGNGTLIEESNMEDGMKLTHWHEPVDISTKVMVIGVSRFAVKLSGMVRDIPVQAWVYPQNRVDGFHDYAPAVMILNFYDTLIGAYSYKKLANVQSKTRYGGMENASNIFYYENSVTGQGTVDELIAHEVAHQWFGNSATEKDWHHIWLSEGFATYFTKLYVENFKGKQAFQLQMIKDREGVISYYDKNPVPVVNTEIKEYTRLLNTNSYQKGSWVLHMLRYKVGYANFINGIRYYYTSCKNSNALTEDFKNAIEEVSGMELDSFFNQWIFNAGHPELNITWHYETKHNELIINVLQMQEFIFEFPLDIGINGEIYTTRISKRDQRFTFSQSKEPYELILDPDTKLLFEAFIEKK